MTRIAWFTPFGPESDIGSFSRTVVHAIDAAMAAPFEGIELVIERNGPSYRPHVPFGFTDDGSVAGDRLPVFNIGNNRENHFAINSRALSERGIVVIHDVVMHDYLVWHHLEHRRDRLGYCAELAAAGETAALEEVVADFSRAGPREGPPPWERGPIRSIPLLGNFVRRALGVVVHSEYAARIVEPLTPAPVCRLYLPADQKPLYDDAAIAAWAAKTAFPDCLTVTSFGHITRNKRLDALIEAFAGSAALRARARLRIVGHARDLAYVAQLQEQIAGAGEIDAAIELSVDDRRLEAIKAETDIFVLLREPNTEGASGSLVEALNTGRPVVVIDSGAFAEIPDDACVKLASVDALPAALDMLIADPEGRIAIGASGRRFQQTRLAAAYAAEFLAFARDVAQIRSDILPAGGCRGMDGETALGILAERTSPQMLAALICRVKNRRSPGSAAEVRLARMLKLTDAGRRAQLCRAFAAMTERLAEHEPRPLSDALSAPIRQLALLAGPVGYQALYPQAGDDAVMAFTLRGPVEAPIVSADAFGIETVGLDLGTELELSGPIGLEGLSSWYRAEAKGRWTRGRHAVFPIRLNEPAEGDLVFEVFIRILFQPAAIGRLRASVDGRPVEATIEDSGAGWSVRVALPAQREQEGWLVILDLAEAGRPADRGQSTDGRELGAFVTAIAIHRAVAA